MTQTCFTNRAIGINALREKIGLGRVTIWRRLKDDPTFPRPLHLGGNSYRWLESEIDAWLDARASARPDR